MRMSERDGSHPIGSWIERLHRIEAGKSALQKTGPFLRSFVAASLFDRSR